MPGATDVLDRHLLTLSRRLRQGPDWASPTLAEALEREFLGPLIDARVRYLAAEGRGAGGSDADIRKDVADGYRKALQARLASPFLPEWPRLASASSEIGQVLGNERLRCGRPLDTAAFADRDAYARWLGGLRPPAAHWRDAWRRADFARWPVQLVASAMLTAVQQLAFERVLRDYRADQALPLEVRSALTALIARTAADARALEAAPALPSGAQWEQRIEIAEARLSGRMLLPLKAIPSAALQFDGDEAANAAATHEQAEGLARQFRHLDGVVLVTGYRGVGKTSFVNRTLHLATAGQEGLGDDWLLVPVVVSVAKASGVSSVLRVTLRAIRDALLGSDGAGPAQIPGGTGSLPLRDDERELLDWAYLRATLKVAFSRSAEDQSEWSASAGIGLDPGKWLAAIAPTASLSAKRSRQEKLRRELSLLDYDEDAAESDIARLIERLARPRDEVDRRRIRLVIVFDELDKLDFHAGVKPLLDGLKNLFLRPHAVFVLVTSKKMYYELRDQRAVEDAALSSYFSAVIHVPLLEAGQVREQLEGWIDRGLWGTTSSRHESAEAAAIERVARFLTYKSLGNPRDLIRELRQLQRFTGVGPGPVLDDAVLRAPAVAAYAAVQQAIEATGVPWRNEADPAASAATQATERAGADEARLEQLRRGLYILVETAIDRQTLVLDDDTLEPIRKANLSLYMPADVRELALQLGRQLEVIATRSIEPGGEPWFKLSLPARGSKVAPKLGVTTTFYRLTGRRAAAELGSGVATDAALPNAASRAQQAEDLFAHGGRAERMLAISLCSQLQPSDIGDALKAQLAQVLQDDGPDFRRRVIEGLPLPVLLDDSVGLAAAAAREGQAAVWDAAALRMAEVDDGSPLRPAAVEVLRRLIGCHATPLRSLFGRVMSGMGTGLAAFALSKAPLRIEDALRALARLAQANLSGELLAWLGGQPLASAAVHAATVDAAIVIAARHRTDLLPAVHGAPKLLAVASVVPALAARREAIVGARHRQAMELLLAGGDGDGPRQLLAEEVKAASAAGDVAAAELIVDRLLVPAPAEGDDAAAKLLDSGLALSEPGAKTMPWLEAEVARRRGAGAASPAELDAVLARLKRVAETKPSLSWLYSVRGAAKAPAPQLHPFTGFEQLLAGRANPGLGLSAATVAALGLPGPQKSGLIERSAVFEPDGRAALMAALAVALLVGVWFVPDGWPASAELLKTRFGSRAALLAILVVLAVLFWNFEGQTTSSSDSLWASSSSTEFWASQAKYGVALAAMWGVNAAHEEWVGAWEPWPVLLPVGVACVAAVVLCYVALRRAVYPRGRFDYRLGLIS